MGTVEPHPQSRSKDQNRAGNWHYQKEPQKDSVQNLGYEFPVLNHLQKRKRCLPFKMQGNCSELTSRDRKGVILRCAGLLFSKTHVSVAAAPRECPEATKDSGDQDRMAIHKGEGRPGPFGGREVRGQWAGRYQNKVRARTSWEVWRTGASSLSKEKKCSISLLWGVCKDGTEQEFSKGLRYWWRAWKYSAHIEL